MVRKRASPFEVWEGTVKALAPLFSSRLTLPLLAEIAAAGDKGVTSAELAERAQASQQAVSYALHRANYAGLARVGHGKDARRYATASAAGLLEALRAAAKVVG